MARLKELAKKNPTMLGDPVSLKAETSDRNPTPAEGGAAAPSSSGDAASTSESKNTKGIWSTGSSVQAPAPTEGDLDQKPDAKQKPGTGHKSLKDVAKENPKLLGDPVSLKAETSDTEPTKDDRGAKRDSKL